MIKNVLMATLTMVSVSAFAQGTMTTSPMNSSSNPTMPNSVKTTPSSTEQSTQSSYLPSSPNGSPATPVEASSSTSTNPSSVR